MTSGMPTHKVYALSGMDLVVRYVGRTRCSLEERLSGHIQTARHGKKPLHHWVREQGDNLVMRELERFESDGWYFSSEAVRAESKWVKHYAKAGNGLFNVNLMPKPGPRVLSLEDQEKEEGETQ